MTTPIRNDSSPTIGSALSPTCSICTSVATPRSRPGRTSSLAAVSVTNPVKREDISQPVQQYQRDLADPRDKSDEGMVRRHRVRYGSAKPRDRTWSSSGAKCGGRLANSTWLPRAASACSVRNSSRAPVLSSRPSPPRSIVTCRPCGNLRSFNRRSSSLALDDEPLAFGPQHKLALFIRCEDRCGWRHAFWGTGDQAAANDFPTTRKAAMPQRKACVAGRGNFVNGPESAHPFDP